MKTTVLFFISVMIFYNPVFASRKATGIVYLDENGNGLKDDSEPGVSGVGVSNGRDVVKTDKKGRYALNVDDDDILFVIQPAGYRVPVDENNLRQFYYIHKPGGSPELKYDGVAPTGPLPASIDFPLLKGDDSDDFSILVFGDTQPYRMMEVDYLGRDVVAELIGVESFQFGMTLGDLVGDDLDLHAAVNSMVGRIGIPWHHVMGNHDENYDVKTDELADERYEATYGPTTYSFNYGKVHFIVFDDILYPDPRDGEGYWGGLRDDQLTFIENDLRFVPEDHLIVLTMHIPMFGNSGYNKGFKGEVLDRLLRLLKRFPYTFSMSAHTHTQRHHFYKEGDWEHHHYVVGTACGDWWSGWMDENGLPHTMMRDGTPNGYARIHFEGNRYEIDYKVARAPETYRMNITVPLVAPIDQRFRGELVVNVFNGSERDKVEFRVDDQNWQAMQHVKDKDPAYLRILQTWDTLPDVLPGRRPSKPVDCAHLWKAEIPTNLPLGAHTLEVRVTDMFGRTFSDYTTYRIVEP